MSEPKPKKSLLELRTTGFAKLRAERIHLRCPACGRKMSNMPRDEFDPPQAFLVEVVCEKFGAGCKIDGPSGYYDSTGAEVPNNFDCPDCGDMVFYGMRHDCDGAY